jgi:nucleoside-diphosphate-sugar epimerase
MKLFVTGGTGVIGKPALAALVADGHEVSAVARTDAKADLVRSLGATPVEVDLFDPMAVRRAVEGHDAVAHLATNIPPVSKATKASAWETTDRLRREVTCSLVDAAIDAGVGRFVKESLAFIYPESGDRLVDEDTPIDSSNQIQATALESEQHVGRFTAAGGTGVVLRFGMFYGPDAATTDEALRFAHFRIAWPVVGDGDQWFPSLHSDDAGSSVAAAMTAPAGIYNVSGTTSTKRAYADAFSAAFGLKRLHLVSPRLVRIGTRGRMGFALCSQRIDPERFHAATGWSPAHATVEDGWTAVAAARNGAVHVRT